MIAAIYARASIEPDLSAGRHGWTRMTGTVGIGVTSLLCLVSFATSASAECAWVLWLRTDVPTVPAQDPWGVVQAFATRADCITGMRALGQKVSTPGSVINEDTTGGSFAVVSKDGIAFSFGKCLPDTVDPRGPKGK